MSTTISALPPAPDPLTGTEQVPIVQDGATVRTTVDAVAARALDQAAADPEFIDQIVPDQTGQAGDVLTTDGTNVSWQPGGGGGGAPTTATYITADDESGDLPNSLQLVAGSNITFDLSTPGELEINAAGGGGGGDLTLLSSADFNTFVDQEDGSTGTLFSLPYVAADFANGDFFELEARWFYQFSGAGPHQMVVSGIGGTILTATVSTSGIAFFTLRIWGQVNAGGLLFLSLEVYGSNTATAVANSSNLLSRALLSNPIAPTYEIANVGGGSADMPFFGATLTRLR